jgi:hypothetical protein
MIALFDIRKRIPFYSSAIAVILIAFVGFDPANGIALRSYHPSEAMLIMRKSDVYWSYFFVLGSFNEVIFHLAKP